MFIKNYPNYTIDKSGRVYNIKKSKFVSVYLRRGYQSVALKNENGWKVKYIHRLLVEHYKPYEYRENLFVRHLDDNPQNNSLENLAVGTQKDNHNDCIRNGHYSPIDPKKLTQKTVDKIRRLYAEGMSIGEIDKKMRISGSHVRAIVNNKIWK